MDINGCGKLLDQDLTPSLSFLRVNSCPLLTEKFAEAEQEFFISITRVELKG